MSNLSFSVVLFTGQDFDFKESHLYSTSLLYKGYTLGKWNTKKCRNWKQVLMSKWLRGNLWLKCFWHIVWIDQNSNFHFSEVLIKMSTFLIFRNFVKSKNRMHKSGNTIFCNKYAFNTKTIGLIWRLFVISEFYFVLLFCFLASLLCYKWLENESYFNYLMTAQRSPPWGIYSIFSAKVKTWRRQNAHGTVGKGSLYGVVFWPPFNHSKNGSWDWSTSLPRESSQGLC